MLEPSYVLLGVKFYTDAFQSMTNHNYRDQMFNRILVTPGTRSNRRTTYGWQLYSIDKTDQKIYGNGSRKSYEIERATIKLRDLFGVYWLLKEYQKEYYDIHMHIDPCERCNQFERHLPAICD
ncbi:LOW QUALITY PROTEIN: hypothetical protein HID58_006130 [Brassica napus]|uniref:Uncharacterized protein n=1 Tax=Brassica napus TaxID=3708 RepID=A0ABQ8EAI6_BRANA|nr:LOW QUALITY PROTEIN: hypothetical protein HID58_006130 [Brassica napus]